MKKMVPIAGILGILFVATFFIPQEEQSFCYWEILQRTNEERHPLNLIFEPPEYAHDPEKAAIQMATYASLMGFDFIGTRSITRSAVSGTMCTGRPTRCTA